jgi:hypothetical protein
LTLRARSARSEIRGQAIRFAANTSEAAKTKFTDDKGNRIVSVQDPLGKITKATYDKMVIRKVRIEYIQRIILSFQEQMLNRATIRMVPRNQYI